MTTATLAPAKAATAVRAQRVTKVFGQCGHTNYALIDACHKLGIEYVSFRHEQQAAPVRQCACVDRGNRFDREHPRRCRAQGHAASDELLRP